MRDLALPAGTEATHPGQWGALVSVTAGPGEKAGDLPTANGSDYSQAPSLPSGRTPASS